MKSLLRNLMLFLASIFTSIFILPLVLLLVIFPLILYRKLILSLASYKTDIYRPLNISSSVFSWDDMYRKPTCSICLALFLKNKHDINQVIGRLESIVEKYPELSCTLHRWMGTIFWKKSPTFQLSRHLTINEESDPEKITHYLDTLPEKPYRKDAPLWEFVSLPNYENGTKSALILRLHHSLGDGLACISVLSDFCDNKGGHTVLENIKGKFHKKKPPSWPRRFLNFLQLIFITPTEFAYLLLKGIDSNPLTIQVPDRSGEIVRCHNLVALDMTDLKQISARTRTNVTSLMSAGIAGVMREIMRKRGANRDATALYVLPNISSHPGTLTNNIIVVPMRMPLLEASREERLLQISNQFRHFFNSTLLVGAAAVFSGNALVASILKKEVVFPAAVTLVHSNIAIFEEDGCEFFGNPVERVLPIVGLLQTSCSLMITNLSYKGKMGISVTADKTLFSDKEELEGVINDITDEINKLGQIK